MSTPIPAERIGPAPRTPEWLAARRNPDDPRFGASDAAAILGVGDYNTALGVYTEFVAPEQVAEPDRDKARRMSRGQIYERAIQQDWAEEKETPLVADIPMIFHRQAPLFATLDGRQFTGCTRPLVLLWDGITEHERARVGVPIESKFSMSPKIAQQLGEEDTDWVPSDWYCQVQQQMDVVDEQEAVICVLLYGKLKTYRVQRRQSVIDAICDKADEMRRRILKRLPPSADHDHSTTKSLIDRLSLDVEGGEMEAPEHVQKLVDDVQRVSSERLELEKLEKKLKSQIKAAMVEHDVDVFTLPEGKPLELTTVSVGEKFVDAYKYTKLKIPKRKVA